MKSVSLAQRTYLALTAMMIILLLIFGYYDAKDSRQHLLKEKELELAKIVMVLDQRIPSTIKTLLTDAEIEGMSYREAVRRFSPILQPIADELGEQFPGYGLGYAIKQRVAVYPLKPEELELPTPEPAQRMLETKEMVTAYMPSAPLGDGQPVLTVYHPHIKDDNVVAYSWANTKVATMGSTYMGTLWHHIPVFFLLWLVLMLILRYSFQRIDRELCGFTNYLRNYRSEGTQQDMVFREMSATLHIIEELRGELRDKASIIEEQEQLFSICMDNMVDQIIILHPILNDEDQIVDFTIEFVNHAVCKAHRKPKEQLIGKRLLEVLPGLAGETFEADHHVYRTGEPIELDTFTYRDTNGCLNGVYERQVIKVKDGIAVLVRNITDKARLQEDLIQRKQEYQILVEHCP
jgi:PAS domain-containing protein